MNVFKSISTEFDSKRVRQFERRSRLPLRRDCLWQILSGGVRVVTYVEDGTYVTLGLWGAGDVVSPVLSKADPYQIECLTPVEAILLPLNQCDRINEALIVQFQELQQFIEILHSRPVDISLLKLLNWLAQKFGRQVEGGQAIDLRLTHQEIAEILGITRVTVSRLLKELEEQGAIARHPRQFIVVCDRDPFWYYEI
jgi:CRP-like cAMP-binding protein